MKVDEDFKKTLRGHLEQLREVRGRCGCRPCENFSMVHFANSMRSFSCRGTESSVSAPNRHYEFFVLYCGDCRGVINSCISKDLREDLRVPSQWDSWFETALLPEPPEPERGGWDGFPLGE